MVRLKIAEAFPVGRGEAQDAPSATWTLHRARPGRKE
jgi:hypothetical protein